MNSGDGFRHAHMIFLPGVTTSLKVDRCWFLRSYSGGGQVMFSRRGLAKYSLPAELPIGVFFYNGDYMMEI